jgi:hypothetical protein
VVLGQNPLIDLVEVWWCGRWQGSMRPVKVLCNEIGKSCRFCGRLQQLYCFYDSL